MDYKAKQILQRIVDDGTFDDIRKRVLKQVKQKEELSNFIERAVLKSKALKKCKAGKNGKPTKQEEKEVYNEVRKELEVTVLEAAVKATWEVLQDEATGVPQTIKTEVHQALRDLLHEDYARARGDDTPEYSC